MHEFRTSTYITSAKPSHGQLEILLSHMALPALFFNLWTEIRFGETLRIKFVVLMLQTYSNFWMMQTFTMILPNLVHIVLNGMPHAFIIYARLTFTMSEVPTSARHKQRLAIMWVWVQDCSFKGVFDL